MRSRRLVVLLAATVLVLPAAAEGGDGVVASASGGVHWTIPLPNPFGIEVGNRTLAFDAKRYADGTVGGRFEYRQVVEGEAFRFNVDVTCFRVYDGNRAKIGGVIVASNDPVQVPGRYAWSRSSTTARARLRHPTARASSPSAPRPPTRRSATARTLRAGAAGRRADGEHRRALAGEPSGMRSPRRHREPSPGDNVRTDLVNVFSMAPARTIATYPSGGSTRCA